MMLVKCKAGERVSGTFTSTDIGHNRKLYTRNESTAAMPFFLQFLLLYRY